MKLNLIFIVTFQLLLNFVNTQSVETENEPIMEFTIKINAKYTGEVGVNVNSEVLDDFKKITSIEFLEHRTKSPKNLTVSNLPEFNYLKIEKQGFKHAPKLKSITVGSISFGYNQIQVIKNSTFENVEVGDIYLHANNINSIEDQTFPRILMIVLNCNNLTIFKSSWFQQPNFLATIYMRNNQITTLWRDTFKDVTNLRHLVLSSNKIKTLSGGIFRYKNTHTLDLANNLLYEIKGSWFTEPNVTISRLYVDFNRLSYLKEDFMKKVRVLYAFFSGNPWQCPCLEIIKKWMLNTTVYQWVIDEYKNSLPVCVYAQSFHDKCVTFVDQELYETYISGTDVKYKVNECSSLYY